MSNQNLAVFTFRDNSVQVITIDGEPWFVAKDLCDVLGVKNSRDALTRLDEDEKGVASTDTLGGNQDVAIVSESGMYALVLSSRKPEAKPFRKWVTSEVLPAIRKTGGYSVIEPAIASTKNATSFTEEISAEINILNQCLQIANIDPTLISGLVLNHAGKRVPQLSGTIDVAHKLLAATTETELLLTPTSIGKRLGISARKVNLLLLDIGYQVRNTAHAKGEPDYLPTELGAPYAANTMATGKLFGVEADNTTYQHLKWKSAVIEILREHLPLN